MPALKCRVLNCQNTSNDIKTRHISFYPFPEDPKIINEWVERCGQPKEFITKSARLCSIHFSERDFENKGAGSKRMTTRKRSLKKHCVPTLFMPDVMEISVAKEKSLPKRRRRTVIIKRERVEKPETKSVNETGTGNSAGAMVSLESAKLEDFNSSDADSELEANPSFALSKIPRDEVIFDVSSTPPPSNSTRPRLFQKGVTNSSKSKVNSLRKVIKIGSKSSAFKSGSWANYELMQVMKSHAQVNAKQALVNEIQAHVNETLAMVSFTQAISTVPAPTATLLIEAFGSPNFRENLRVCQANGNK